MHLNRVMDVLNAWCTAFGQQGALLQPGCSSRAQEACAHDCASTLGCGVAPPSHAQFQDGRAPAASPSASSATGVRCEHEQRDPPHAVTVRLAVNKHSSIAVARIGTLTSSLSEQPGSRHIYAMDSVCSHTDWVSMMHAGFHGAGCRPGSAAGLCGDHCAAG